MLRFASVLNAVDGGAGGRAPPTPSVRIRIRAKPRASRTRVLGVRADGLEVALAAPPVDGEANAALCAVLADVLGVAKSHVRVVVGVSSRTKVVEVAGLSLSDAEAALERALGPATGA